MHLKRSKHEGSIVVYQYGTPHWADLDEEGINQLRLANNLWNKLVEIERRCDETAKTAEQGVSVLEEAEQAVGEAANRVAELKEQLKRERVKYRTTNIRTTTSAELKATRQVLNTAKARRKVVRQEVQEQRRTIRKEANTIRDQETGKDMYRIWTERGLGWGTYNDVKDRMDTTRQRVIKRRTQGESAKFNFHLWKGVGTLHVQCQQPTGKERRVEWEIIGDHPKHKTLRLRIGRACGLGSHWLEIPFVYHRSLPCSPQDVTGVRVTRRMLAGKSEITIQFSCRVPKVEPRRNGSSVWIRLVWKSEGQAIHADDIAAKDICVARIASSDPLPQVPEDLAQIVRRFGSRHADVVLPATYIWPLKRDDDIKSIRDRMLDGLRVSVLAALKDEDIRALVKDNPAQWKAQAQFAALAKRIPKSHPLHEITDAWLREDRHLWQYERHERDQTIARRRDTYRKIAAWLATDAQVFGLLEADYSEIKKRPTESEDSYKARGGRQALQRVAPGELRLFINQAAVKNGIQVMLDERGRSNGDDGVNGADGANGAGNVSDTEHLEIAAGTGD